MRIQAHAVMKVEGQVQVRVQDDKCNDINNFYKKSISFAPDID